MMQSTNISFGNMEIIHNVYIGDWVRVVDYHNKVHIATAQINSRVLKDHYTSSCGTISFLPIFLDESTLEKSRFEIVQHLDNGCIAEYKCMQISEDKGDSQIYIQIQLKSRFSTNDESNILIYSDDEVKAALPIKYVHELQHILDMCGLPSNRIVDVNFFEQNIINKKLEDTYNNYVKSITEINYKTIFNDADGIGKKLWLQ